MDYADYVLEFRLREVVRGRVAGHEVVEDGHGARAGGFVEEDGCDEQAEGVVGETLLHDAKGGRGEGWEGEDGRDECWSGLVAVGLGEVGRLCRMAGPFTFHGDEFRSGGMRRG